MNQAAERYAETLIELAFEKKNEDQVRDDMQLVGQALSNQDLSSAILSPIVDDATKKQIVEKLFDGKIQAISLNFIKLIIDKGRDQLLQAAAEIYQKLYNERKGIQTVHLTTAAALTNEQFDTLKTKVKDKYFADKQLDIHHHIDESLIGGFVLEFNNQLVDASIKNKLSKLLNTYSN
jgi:F-type H+-transporting ATPase subunit delta